MAESISLPLKTTTQTIIVRKLSAFALKNKTRRALWEYDHILRGLYLVVIKWTRPCADRLR